MGIEEYDPYFKDDEDTKGWTEQYNENGDDIMEEMGVLTFLNKTNMRHLTN